MRSRLGLAVRGVRLLARVASPAAHAAPAGRRQRALARCGHIGLYVSLAVTAMLVLGLAAAESRAAWLSWLKLALGAVLLAEGWLLAADVRGARRLILWRLQRNRRQGVATTRLAGARRHLARRGPLPRADRRPGARLRDRPRLSRR
jgi:hypothetical protein